MGDLDITPWLKSLPVAPEYRPTESEFEDPIAYILKIEKEAKQYGICKIIPPVSKPPKREVIARLNRELKNGRFSTRQQQLGWSPKRSRGCLVPTLQSVVKKTVWESGETYTIEEFESKAKAFSKSRLKTPREVSLVPLVIETLFWDAAGDRPISVEYGNDLPVSAFRKPSASVGSASASRAKRYNGATLDVSDTAWNMRSVSRIHGSLLKFMAGDIAGVTTPMLYIGMLFSWFAWHVEDHDLHSLNYLHAGAAKSWYAVPGEAASAFEEVVRTDGFGGQVNPLVALAILSEKTTVMSPEVLVAAGVPCCRLVQNPGEFVITFPRAYHLGFCHGFNCGEATNLATAGWLKKAKESAMRRSVIKHIPMFSHQQLLYLQAMTYFSGISATLSNEPRSKRLKVKKKGEGEIIVKSTFVVDVIENNYLLNILLQKSNVNSVVLWTASTVSSELAVSSSLQIDGLQTEMAVGNGADATMTNADEVTNSKISTRDSNTGEADFFTSSEKSKEMTSSERNNRIPYQSISHSDLEPGVLKCVSCGTLGFTSMVLIQPYEDTIKKLNPNFSEDDRACLNNYDTENITGRAEYSCAASSEVAAQEKGLMLDNNIVTHSETAEISHSPIATNDFRNTIKKKPCMNIDEFDLHGSQCHSDNDHFDYETSCKRKQSPYLAPSDTAVKSFEGYKHTSQCNSENNSPISPSAKAACNRVGNPDCEKTENSIEALEGTNVASTRIASIMEKDLGAPCISALDILASTYCDLEDSADEMDEDGCDVRDLSSCPCDAGEEKHIAQENNNSMFSLEKDEEDTEFKCSSLAPNFGNVIDSVDNFDSVDKEPETTVNDSSQALELRSRMLINTIKPLDGFSRPQVFCLEHAVEAEEQLQKLGGAQLLVLCHKDYPVFERYARSFASDANIGYEWKHIPYREVNADDLSLIHAAIDEEEDHDDCSNWTVQLGMCLRFSVKISKSPLYHRQLPYSSVLNELFVQNRSDHYEHEDDSGLFYKRQIKRKRSDVAGRWCGKVWMVQHVHPHLRFEIDQTLSSGIIQNLNIAGVDQLYEYFSNNAVKNETLNSCLVESRFYGKRTQSPSMHLTDDFDMIDNNVGFQSQQQTDRFGDLKNIAGLHGSNNQQVSVAEKASNSNHKQLKGHNKKEWKMKLDAGTESDALMFQSFDQEGAFFSDKSAYDDTKTCQTPDVKARDKNSINNQADQVKEDSLIAVNYLSLTLDTENENDNQITHSAIDQSNVSETEYADVLDSERIQDKHIVAVNNKGTSYHSDNDASRIHHYTRRHANTVYSSHFEGEMRKKDKMPCIKGKKVNRKPDRHKSDAADDANEVVLRFLRKQNARTVGNNKDCIDEKDKEKKMNRKEGGQKYSAADDANEVVLRILRKQNTKTVEKNNNCIEDKEKTTNTKAGGHKYSASDDVNRAVRGMYMEPHARTMGKNNNCIDKEDKEKKTNTKADDHKYSASDDVNRAVRGMYMEPHGRTLSENNCIDEEDTKKKPNTKAAEHKYRASDAVNKLVRGMHKKQHTRTVGISNNCMDEEVEEEKAKRKAGGPKYISSNDDKEVVLRMNKKQHTGPVIKNSNCKDDEDKERKTNRKADGSKYCASDDDNEVVLGMQTKQHTRAVRKNSHHIDGKDKEKKTKRKASGHNISNEDNEVRVMHNKQHTTTVGKNNHMDEEDNDSMDSVSDSDFPLSAAIRKIKEKKARYNAVKNEEEILMQQKKGFFPTMDATPVKQEALNSTKKKRKSPESIKREGQTPLAGNDEVLTLQKDDKRKSQRGSHCKTDVSEGGPSTRLRPRSKPKEAETKTKMKAEDKVSGKAPKKENNVAEKVFEQQASSRKKPQGKSKLAKVKDEEKSVYCCDMEGCTMTLPSKKDLNLHKRNICTFKTCGKQFFSHKYLVQHRRVHLDDRPLVCTWKGCKMTFKWAWARTEHLRVHTGERPYVCKMTGCGKTFRFVSDFSRHKRKTGHLKQ